MFRHWCCPACTQYMYRLFDTCHLSYVKHATCCVVHKSESSLGAYTGECHASDCYKDSGPSVHALDESKGTLSEAMQEVER